MTLCARGCIHDAADCRDHGCWWYRQQEAGTVALWVFVRRRDEHTVYWTGQVAWGAADMHQPVMTDKPSEARKFVTQAEAHKALDLWPGLTMLTLVKAPLEEWGE